MSTPLAVISSMATRLILAELAHFYIETTGRRVTVESVGGVDALRRIPAGEAFDVVVLAADALSQLVQDGFVVADSVCPFALSPTAVAVPAGADRPRTVDARSIRKLVEAARAVGLSTGPSGTAVRALLQAWNTSDAPLTRVVQAPPGVPVARLIADRQVDVGFQQLSELLGEPGIDIVGAVPAVLLPTTTFSLGLCRSARDAAAARALIDFLCSTDAEPVKRHFGMEPAQPASTS